MRPGPIPVGSVRRVLVRCPNWLGDTVMAVPAVRALRDGLRHAEVWCAGPWVESILGGEAGLGRRLDTPRAWGARLAQARRLRTARVDVAVLLTNSFETALLARLSGARWRIGYAGDGRSLLLTHALRPALEARHQVAAYLALLEPLGIAASTAAPTLAVETEHREEARRLLASLGLDGGMNVVGIQLGAAFGPSKLWPADRLGALAARLGQAGLVPVFLGSPAAAPLLAVVAATMPGPPLSLVGRDRPALLPALLAELTAVVAPDSGPAHVAAAVGTPVVTLFGPTDPRLTAPLGRASTWIRRAPVCAPCFRSRCPIDHRCLRAITVDEVERAVLAHVGLRWGPRRGLCR